MGREPHGTPGYLHQHITRTGSAPLTYPTDIAVSGQENSS
jgi:hypothetical protein